MVFFILWFLFHLSIVFASMYCAICFLLLLLGSCLAVRNQAAKTVLVTFGLFQALILSMLNFNHFSVLGKESNYGIGGS